MWVGGSLPVGSRSRAAQSLHLPILEGLLYREVRPVVEEDEGRSQVSLCETRSTDCGKPSVLFPPQSRKAR